jgi:general secretion pathway protein C
MPMPMVNRLRAVGRKAPAVRWTAVVEMLLLAALAVQLARLVWAVVTPVGAYGDWRGRQAVIPLPAARQALFASFDPFFRAQPSGSGDAVVTSLALTLFGVRVNEGSGGGSAIVATPDGMQASYAVGDEIIPGVMLKAVAFDHIVIDRGGAEESVFLDQSQAAPVAAPEGGAPPPEPGQPDAPFAGPDLTPAEVKAGIGFSPRMQGGKVTGLVVTSKGPGFTRAGLQEGDIVTQVNGRPIGSLADLQALQSQIAPGARISLSVERGASVVPIALTLQGQ